MSVDLLLHTIWSKCILLEIGGVNSNYVRINRILNMISKRLIANNAIMQSLLKITICIFKTSLIYEKMH